MSPPEPRPSDTRLVPAVAEAGWGDYRTAARTRTRRTSHHWASTKPLPPALLAASVVLLDIGMVAGGGLLLRFGPSPEGGPAWPLIGVLILFFVSLAGAAGAYRHGGLFGGRRAMLAALGSLAAALGGTALAALALDARADFGPGLALFWLLLAAPALLGGRLAAAAALRAAPRRTRTRVVLVGDGPQAARFAAALQAWPDQSLRLLGLVDDGWRGLAARGHGQSGVPHLGQVETLLGMIRRGEVDQVVLTLPWAAEARLRRLETLLADYPVDLRLAPDLAAYRAGQPGGLDAGGLPMLRLADRPIRGWAGALKVTEDYVLALGALAVAAVPMALIALAIRLETPGPVLFRQRRTGFNNQEFHVFKFRTMHHADADPGAERQVLEGDPRVTGVGAVLRRTSLDELPQIFNILRGEMSFIGPRPHAPGTRAGGRPFEEVVAHYAARHRVKPGLTGLAQVRGWRGPTQTEEKLIRRVESDLEYIENWSLWLDVVILVRTLVAVARMRNAC
ncbi:exopolysaccharide biosynthesis polyprenyl glycosylphosphotransferase [Siccirubricoccus sp. G192]|uniref:exopolysaccharide biosynthesis polyprenyl glycosylphosphotransferase n=1 Tax=Siccirubricoccus sp. G192 TaxID=2849651 RepID=UPI001C2B7E51|nr:exopolysaccharide biosynthesis polyprenyl glycosylphosphotransferase [Siccirubricoccus sp. G192]MBV1798138.1 exopolysaccharide biosynthesis polyprenyl glycosylphosphotransferase [Siccirubricoccus sp. G192]